MFGIGFTELLMIFTVALLVLGPKRLPEVARKLGRFYREIRSTVDEVKEIVIEEPEKHRPIPPVEEKITTVDDLEEEIDKQVKEEKAKEKQPERKKISFKKKTEGENIDDSGTKKS